MNVIQIRKKLGKLVADLPDKVISQDLKTAEVLKCLFFQTLLQAKKQADIYNKTNNGKT